MRLRTPLYSLFCLVLAVASAPTFAFFGDDEARKQVAELKKTVDALTQRVDGGAQNQFDFANQIETLKSEVARLRGQVEELTHSLESAHKRQQDFYVDLDNRLRKLESAAPTTNTEETASATTAPPVAKADPQVEMRDYEAALGLFRESRYKEAQASFDAFIAKHPQSTLLPSAHYWLGSSLYQQKGFLGAATSFGKVAANWPNDSKAPDALLQQANALVAAKDVNGAIKVLEMLVEKFPTSPAVETARSRLKTLAPKKKR
ncbi:MAG: tol-pal system protein YbgF [Rhodocyclaceae bacterium]|nr:tol-pal system protein YbgF [Rhodocyclaceae bacterium]MDZ4215505.1 tol-pal system protein YbgF [Rhodocyclaceae bacterium]